MSLLELRCPSDVAGLVVPIGIRPAVERHLFGGALANGCVKIFQKLRKVVRPWLVERNSFASPVFVSRMVFVSASFFDRLPRIVGQRSWSLRRIAMFKGADIAEFGAGSATGGVAAAQPRDSSSQFFPAFASAEPMRATHFHELKADGGETSESLSGNVEFTHVGSFRALRCQRRRRCS